MLRTSSRTSLPSLPAPSVGRLTLAWSLVDILQRRTDLARDEVLSVLRRESDAAECMVLDALALAEGLGLVAEQDGALRVAPVAATLGEVTRGQLPDTGVYRGLLLTYVDRARPVWAASAALSRTAVEAYVPNVVSESLSAAKVIGVDIAEGADEWWAALRRIVQDWERDDTALVGYAAEQLTLEYERKRLADCGLGHLGARIRWVSQESDAYGFDILSWVGDLSDTLGQEPTAALRIEVKGSMAGDPERFRFYMTRNEWNTATDSSVAYVLHLWPHVLRQRREDAHVPAVLLPYQLEQRMPEDRSDSVSWTESRLLIGLPSEPSSAPNVGASGP